MASRVTDGTDIVSYIGAVATGAAVTLGAVYLYNLNTQEQERMRLMDIQK